MGGQVKPPIKIKNVDPVYPRDAMESRVEGIVILEITVDANGNVTDARVIRNVAMLDDAALDAVWQWKYTPTTLNGAPVPVADEPAKPEVAQTTPTRPVTKPAAKTTKKTAAATKKAPVRKVVKKPVRKPVRRPAKKTAAKKCTGLDCL